MFDNVCIIKEACAAQRPLLVGDTCDCDMTRAEFFAANAHACLTIVRQELRADNKAVWLWLT